MRGMVSKHPRNSVGMSLLEVMAGIAVLAAVSVGILGTLIQTRRLTEGSIRQNTAVTIAQSYLEQLKSMEYDELSENPVPTVINQGTPDPLQVSPLPESAGTEVVNERLIDINNTPSSTADDLPLHVVVYVEDITDPAHDVGSAKRITLKYGWDFHDGLHTRHYSNVVTAIRSEVPTF